MNKSDAKRIQKARAAVESAEAAHKKAGQALSRLKERIAAARTRVHSERTRNNLTGRTGLTGSAKRATEQLSALLKEQRQLREQKRRAYTLLQQRRLDLRLARAEERERIRIMRQVDRFLSRKAAMPSDAVTVTGAQLRAARSLLDMTVSQFAEMLEVSQATVRRIMSSSTPDVMDKEMESRVVARLRSAGVELIPAGIYVGDGGPGVRLRRTAARQKAARPVNIKEARKQAVRRKKRRVA